MKKAAAGAFAAATIASSALTSPLPAEAFDNQFTFSSTTVVAEKVTREGLYGEYTVDVEQKYDDARSTFKEAKETKSKKGKSHDAIGGDSLKIRVYLFMSEYGHSFFCSRYPKLSL